MEIVKNTRGKEGKKIETEAQKREGLDKMSNKINEKERELR